MDRPRRVPFEYEYKNNRDKEKELEREDNIDPFGVNNPDFLNPVEDYSEDTSKERGSAQTVSALVTLTTPCEACFHAFELLLLYSKAPYIARAKSI